MKIVIHSGTGQAICPVCRTRWGCAWPPVSVCPTCLNEATVARIPKVLPDLGATATSSNEVKRWRDAGWDVWWAPTTTKEETMTKTKTKGPKPKAREFEKLQGRPSLNISMVAAARAAAVTDAAVYDLIAAIHDERARVLARAQVSEFARSIQAGSKKANAPFMLIGPTPEDMGWITAFGVGVAKRERIAVLAIVGAVLSDDQFAPVRSVIEERSRDIYAELLVARDGTDVAAAEVLNLRRAETTDQLRFLDELVYRIRRAVESERGSIAPPSEE